MRRRMKWEADGRESAIGLIDDDDNAFFVNGKSDGSARGDASTQVMAGLVGAMLHPNPRNALVVGLGTGSTAGWLGAVPTMQRVNVVELEPVVLRVADECTAVNHDVLHNPRVRIRIGDAREVLLASRDQYDLIVSEPSNPYRAGIASLFTREFYEAARARLNRGGMFLQWVQTYDVDAETIRTVYATLGAVFPQVSTWRTSEGDLLLVAGLQPVTYDMASLRQRAASEPYRSALHATWRVESAEGFLSHFVGGDRLTRVAGHDAPLNTDDQTPIEFGFARSVGDTSLFSMTDVFGLAAALGAQRIPGIDWRGVLLQRGSDPSVTAPRGDMNAEEVAHHDFARLWSNGNFRGAMNLWIESHGWRPVNTGELAMLAESEIAAGSDDPTPLLDALRRWEPVEADALEAKLMLRRGNMEAATALLVRAFGGYRSTAWPQPDIMERALETAVAIAEADRTKAPVLYDALAQPFAAGQWELSRRATRLALARRIDDCGPRTIASLRALEPWVQWDAPALQTRAACYQRAGLRELASCARAELNAFLDQQPQRLVPAQR